MTDNLNRDLHIIRELARKYADFALSDHCLSKPEQYKIHNGLKIIRPPVLVFEVPWEELSEYEEMKLQCENPEYRSLEWQLRSVLFQKNHFLGDFIVHPYFRSPVCLTDTGIGIEMEEDRINSNGKSAINAHKYQDVLPDDEALEKIRMPEIDIDEYATQQRFNFYSEVFKDILPVKKSGISAHFPVWDQIPRYHGVENCLIDLSDRPNFMHRMVDTFTRIFEHYLDRYERLNILDTDPYYLHCTPACTYELPVKDMETERITAKDIWCRSMAQILGVVSPNMLEEFDLVYIQRLFDRCGLSYYGCCEPLDNKIEKLRRFNNLRRISISSWADVDRAADQIQNDYVLSYKPNPAFVSSGVLQKEEVIKETRRVLEACRRNGTPCEFILKDISTIAGNASVLTDWVDTVNGVIDEYFT